MAVEDDSLPLPAHRISRAELSFRVTLKEATNHFTYQEGIKKNVRPADSWSRRPELCLDCMILLLFVCLFVCLFVVL